ncbi:AAA family ATPase [Streptomyces olivaceoviridis]
MSARADGVHPRVRGRDEELAFLGARFDALAEGRGGVVCMEGPPGSGKTRLLAEVQRMAVERRLRLFRGGARIPTASSFRSGRCWTACRRARVRCSTRTGCGVWPRPPSSGSGCCRSCRTGWSRWRWTRPW